MADIQDIVDEIATVLGNGVSLDDLSGRLVTYSVQQGRADEARIRTLLTRSVPDDVRAWQDRHGIRTATGPVELPPNDGLGMRARLGVPLLHHGVRTGILWILQSDDTWSAPALRDRLASLQPRIDTLAALQYDRATPRLDERRDREATFRRACRADPAALDELRTWPALYALDTVGVVVCLSGGGTEAAQLRVALHQTLSAHPHVLAAAVQDTHTTVLVRAAATDSLHRELTAAAEAVGAQAPVHAGVSGPLKDLGRLPDAYTQAVTAAQAAAVDPELGPLPDWDGIGVYRFLARALRPEAAGGCEPYERLAAADPAGELLRTLEIYYDTVSVNQAAERLHLHRTSLYYRLGRIKDAIGADPLDGAVRLELHLAIKTARWLRRPRV